MEKVKQKSNNKLKNSGIFSPPKVSDPMLRMSPTYCQSQSPDERVKIRINNNFITSLSEKYGKEDIQVLKGKRITEKKGSLIFEAEEFKDKYSKKVVIPSRRKDHQQEYFYHTTEQMEKIMKFDKKQSCPQNLAGNSKLTEKLGKVNHVEYGFYYYKLQTKEFFDKSDINIKKTNQNYSNIFSKEMGEKDSKQIKRVKQRKKQLSSDMRWQDYDSIKHQKDVGAEIKDTQQEVDIIIQFRVKKKKNKQKFQKVYLNQSSLDCHDYYKSFQLPLKSERLSDRYRECKQDLLLLKGPNTTKKVENLSRPSDQISSNQKEKSLQVLTSRVYQQGHYQESNSLYSWKSNYRK